ncbi:hypothetical protein [Pedobacter sp.]|uniref:DUF7009 family protein n=1 Tax=Pedobacter sp. TaxID=1411316 RepID=UPI0031E0CD16
MKIRIKGNSLRYRLTKSEVEKLGADGFLSESSHFLSNTLEYAITTTADGNLRADFMDNRMVLYMPEKMVQELVHTDRVGFSGLAGSVSLLVEKDFTCLDNVEEDQSDNYPNPLLNS